MVRVRVRGRQLAQQQDGWYVGPLHRLRREIHWEGMAAATTAAKTTAFTNIHAMVAAAAAVAAVS
jgi:hypothetical protein